MLSATELEALSPAGAGTQDITVETEFGGTTPTSATDQFTYGSREVPGAARRGHRRAAPAIPAQAARGALKQIAATDTRALASGAGSARVGSQMAPPCSATGAPLDAAPAGGLGHHQVAVPLL